MEHVRAVDELLLDASDEDARRLARAVAVSGRLEWISSGGASVRLTERGAQLVAHLLEALVDGREVTIGETDKLLSPEEAASILGVSRPTVVKWLTEGRIADHPVGTQHRLVYGDVLRLLGQRRAIAELAREQAQRALAATDPGPSDPAAAARGMVLAGKGDGAALDETRDAQLRERAAAAARRARRP
jgi:excisionase family DNA binding protein